MNPETQKASSAEIVDEMHEYLDRLRDGAEKFLLKPALKKIIFASEAEERLNPEEVDALLIAEAEGDTKTQLQLTAKLVQEGLDWRTDANGKVLERHEMPDDKDLSDEYRSIIKDAIDELDEMNREIPIPKKRYKRAAVLGATVGPVAGRTEYLFSKLEESEASAESIVGLGAERLLNAVDLRNSTAYPYVNDSKVETDLLSFAQQAWFTEHGFDTPQIDRYPSATSLLRDQNYDSRYGFQTVSFAEGQKKPDWAPETIVNVSAPYNKAHHQRANTGETINFLKEITDSQEGDEWLFISHQPYVLGQRFEIERICLEGGLRADVAGYKSQNLNNLPATLLGGEIGKAAQKAAELIAYIDQLAG